MKKARTQLLRALQKDTSEDNEKRIISRRDFLNNTTKAGLLLAITNPLSADIFTSVIKPKIAILGSGIAGLTAAHYLHKHQLDFRIYEALVHVGGRMQTAVNVINDDITSEIGGEFIDTNHYEIRRLAKEFGFVLKDHSKDPLNTPQTKETYSIKGTRYKLKEVIHNFNGFAPRIKKDKISCGPDFDTPSAAALDRISISGYFNRMGIHGWLRELLEAAYKAEFGADCHDQSALNFISMISVDTRYDFEVFGDSDERFGIVGGNGTLPRKIAERYTAYIQLEKILTAVRSRGRSFVLSFADGAEEMADYVICTIPFSVLKDIDLQLDGMSKGKRSAITELGYGNNAKLIMGFNDRPWRINNGAAGYLINESIHNGWDSSNMQNNNMGPGGYSVYTSAQEAVDLARWIDNPQKAIDKYLPQLDRVFDGCQGSFNGKSIIANWPELPTIKGAYSYYKPRQWTHLSGLEAEPVGNFLFAGEHCSGDFQGYMNGGAQTGKDAALYLAKKLKR